MTGRPKTLEKSQAVFLLWVELEASDAFLVWSLFLPLIHALSSDPLSSTRFSVFSVPLVGSYWFYMFLMPSIAVRLQIEHVFCTLQGNQVSISGVKYLAFLLWYRTRWRKVWKQSWQKQWFPRSMPCTRLSGALYVIKMLSLFCLNLLF